MINKLEVLKFIGFFEIRNVATGFFFDSGTVKWSVEFYINLGDGFKCEQSGYGEIDPIIDQVYDEVMTWLSHCYPDYFKELVDRYNTYADEQKPVSKELGCHQ